MEKFLAHSDNAVEKAELTGRPTVWSSAVKFNKRIETDSGGEHRRPAAMPKTREK